MPEKEYIERKALMHDIMRTVIVSEKTGYTNPELKGINKVIDRIKAQPTADVQEVKYGKNVTTEHPVDEFICSECGIVFKDFSEYIPEEDVYREFYFKYCPNCGAKMDKE